MGLKTNAEWVEWGRRDPLFGVANWKGKSLDGATPWTDGEFYALGESDWGDFEMRWRKYGYTPGIFVEIGCGAGRITKQLSLAFERGIALDVSEDMIRYASVHVPAKNIDWRVTQGLTVPVADNSVDAIFSCHVFQHLASTSAGYTYFAEFLRALKPGGALMIHLPIHMFPYMVSQKFAGLCSFLYRWVLKAEDVKSAYKRYRMGRGAAPPMHGMSYDQVTLHRTLTEMGFVRVEFATFPLTSNDVLHGFVMATKPPPSSKEQH
ncbi:MAG TPA: class I SAM-dependent methyltransferase [Candidatus Acidoferrum sp.]|jgi:ubiquinone/menaquinone biosynthesis C-methylase UbiE